ncbi:MAG: hypothetical protein ACK56F_14305 [bacterium]
MRQSFLLRIGWYIRKGRQQKQITALRMRKGHGLADQMLVVSCDRSDGVVGRGRHR